MREKHTKYYIPFLVIISYFSILIVTDQMAPMGCVLPWLEERMLQKPIASYTLFKGTFLLKTKVQTDLKKDYPVNNMF